MEHPIKMDDLGVPLFLETPMCVCWLVCVCVLTLGDSKLMAAKKMGLKKILHQLDMIND